MSSELKKRSDIHWARKSWHVIGVGLLTLIYAYFPKSTALGIFVMIWLCFVPGDLIRRKFPALNDLVLHVFKSILRESEVKGPSGTTYLLSGVFLVALIFPRDVVLLTLLFLGFADPAASLIGIKYGKDKIFGHKSLQGSVAAFVVCFILMVIYLFIQGFPVGRLIIMSLIGGLVGALAELIPIGKLDDNLSLPILSAVSIWILFMVFGELPLIAS